MLSVAAPLASRRVLCVLSLCTAGLSFKEDILQHLAHTGFHGVPFCSSSLPSHLPPSAPPPTPIPVLRSSPHSHVPLPTPPLLPSTWLTLGPAHA